MTPLRIKTIWEIIMKFKNEADLKNILEALTVNMNEEFRATLQYICHRILARGNKAVLSEAFKSAALDEMSHILFFSDLITKYGGTIELGEWDTDRSRDIREMLKQDIRLEQDAKERYSSQIDIFAGYPELQTLLKSVLADEQDHEAEFTRYLQELA
jgi:bacterioferritin (cytochrome b1)